MLHMILAALTNSGVKWDGTITVRMRQQRGRAKKRASERTAKQTHRYRYESNVRQLSHAILIEQESGSIFEWDLHFPLDSKLNSNWQFGAQLVC